MEALSPQFNISMKENQSAREPDLHVIIIVVLILVILLVLATIVLFKFVIRLVHKWHDKRAEKALTRAINIYNSQEPLKEPDCVHMRPGDHNNHWITEGRGRQSEIAFVHSDGRIERFRLLAGNSKREESLKKQGCNISRAQLHLLGPHNHHVAGDEEAYANFQQTCANLESIAIRSLGENHEDTVSLRGYDIPPSYEQALAMPVVATGVLVKNDRNRNDGDELEQAYCNVEIGKQSMQIESRT